MHLFRTNHQRCVAAAAAAGSSSNNRSSSETVAGRFHWQPNIIIIDCSGWVESALCSRAPVGCYDSDRTVYPPACAGWVADPIPTDCLQSSRRCWSGGLMEPTLRANRRFDRNTRQFQ